MSDDEFDIKNLKLDQKDENEETNATNETKKAEETLEESLKFDDPENDEKNETVENEKIEKNETFEYIEKLTEKQKELKETGEKLEKKTEEYDVLYDKYLRITAEYENFRKRTVKEKEGIYSDAVVDVLKNILPVLDNFERALQFADSSEPEKVTEGLKMIYAQFIKFLSNIGVEEIIAAGEKFNPEIHNAVFYEEDAGQPDNTVTEVLQKGYIKGDKIIRPAMVKVVN